MGFAFGKSGFRARFAARCVVSRALLAFGVLALFLATEHAAAQKRADHATDAKYQELIRRALEEYASGNWTEARVFFEDAHAISPNARTLRGLGMTSYEARSYVEAIAFLEEALTSQVRPLTLRIAQETRQVLDQARRFVSPVNISIEPDFADLRVDGKPIPKPERERVVLDPGEHEFTASAAGFEPGRSVLVAEGGRRLNLHMVLKSESPEHDEPRAAAVPPPATAPPSQHEVTTPLASSAQQVVAGTVLGVVGVGSIATGWVFYVLRQQVRTKLFAEGVIPTSEVDAFRGRGYLSLAAVGLGATLLAVSDYFWLPDEPGVPAWAWSVGALGVATGIVGLAIGVLGPQCDLGDERLTCQSAVGDSVFGPLLAIHALPLLAVPLAYALRGWSRPAGVEVSVSWGDALASGPGLSVAGRF
jgi:hypothetical protein